MSFAEFVEKNSTECRICKFFKKNPSVEQDIDDVLDSGKPLRHFSLIASFLAKDYGQSFTVDYIHKHYERHKGEE